MNMGKTVKDLLSYMFGYFIITIVGVVLVLLLTGCGRNGELFVPNSAVNGYQPTQNEVNTELYKAAKHYNDTSKVSDDITNLGTSEGY